MCIYTNLNDGVYVINPKNEIVWYFINVDLWILVWKISISNLFATYLKIHIFWDYIV
jgi:hypothetical protein